MGRPQKKVVEYFSHDCNHGETIYILQQKYGNDGYAFWFKLLEKLGATEGHFLDLNKTKTLIHLSAYCMVDEEKLFKILDTLCDLEAIDSKCWKKKIIWCENFIARIKQVYERRKDVDFPESPLNKVNDSDKPQTKLNKTKLKIYMSNFDDFRKAYPGSKRGLDVEFENFTKKNDLDSTIPLLMPALEIEIKHKEKLKSMNEFCPQWKNLSTWINQKCWTQELSTFEVVKRKSTLTAEDCL